MKRRIRKQFGYRCFLCGATRPLHLDHHKPLCLGNPLVYGNVVILCAKCNYAKGTKPPEIFYTKEALAGVEALLAEQKTWAVV